MNAHPRLDQVQIKVNLSGPHIPGACRALRLHSAAGARQQVFFCVDPARAVEHGGTAPLDDGIILRLRESGDRETEQAHSTVKLRPARRSRLTPEWLRVRAEGDEVFRVEADWAGERKVLAASLTAGCAARGLDGVLAGSVAPGRLFTPSQARFLRECADRRVDLDRLRVLGPIEAVRWQSPRPVAGYPVRAERWVLPAPPSSRGWVGWVRPGGRRRAEADECSLLELSIRVEPQGAEIAQIAFETALLTLGLPAEDAHHTKTHRALHRLLGA
ncbi:conserved hypothetical protein [Frankia canadensis]|uniref:CYTH domain-containing protein n=1 Tax=Frankia canadensis TaxID=1836972 RepID=A0A2I2KQ73_9ACTN|nr:hypothetical protein [Frankia canadensis]SNQ47823.1 conserved hypothetical protein [Frankia canadensis]SOU55113.1 conserved hypothetical protein [Frankia canadensis]